MAGNANPRDLGYESPTEHTVTSALAASRLIHRLNELERNTGQNGHDRRQNPVKHDLMTRSEKAGRRRRVGIRDRIACFQWTWFTSTMATGGVANVLAAGA